jgi:hypothetical protein
VRYFFCVYLEATYLKFCVKKPSLLYLKHRLWLSAGFKAGAPYAGARTAELEEAKGTSDEIDSSVVSAHASQVPAGFGSSDVLFCGIS